ncbi:MAG TPA: hypothetical protein VHM70_11800 [Polyangiaceae bacterium]|nr:hypothetical protein [Polyangiaceae bacterium]
MFEAPWEQDLKPGPIGEYLEVVDYDPASGCWYEPVDLNDVQVVAQDGLAPSEGNPQFHQQMVYAVAMNTIANFEQALGRQVFWSATYDPHLPKGKRDTFVQRLRIYPHALRAANAYYSPNKRALLFGYFQGPSGMVFSCLSHDIVAHETTHALLDGMNRRYIEDNHEDSLAFHEAFADLVALFEHFTFPEVLKHQISQTHGDLHSESLLGELAQEFGEATGRYGALRNAIGEYDDADQWHPIKPDPTRLSREFEPHARGAILVAAVFGAFLAANSARVRDLVRLATAGTGVLPAGNLPPDLVNRLATETSTTARHFLNMCIQALDWCPPVDMTFGDYLRALITADFDMQIEDPNGYRTALIESFRRWGIVPKGLRTLSEEQLRWPFVHKVDHDGWNALTEVVERIRPRISESLYIRDRRVLFALLRDARLETHEHLEAAMSDVSDASQRPHFNRVTGLNIAPTSGLPGMIVNENGIARFEVHALRPALRVTSSRTIKKQLVMILTQTRNLPIDPEHPELGDFEFRGGATLIFDLEGERPSLRYSIVRPIDSGERLEEIRAYWKRRDDQGASLRTTYFGAGLAANLKDEPLCLLHGEG